MSAAWERVHERYRVASAVLEDVRRSGRPDAVAGWSEEIEAAFGDLDAFLQHVQRRWYTAIAARVDAVLESDVGDRTTAVRGAWEDLSRHDPASRIVLDAYAAHPALQHGERQHGRLLAAALRSPTPEAAEPAVTTARRVWPRWCPLRTLVRSLATR